jgi:PhnB protein
MSATHSLPDGLAVITPHLICSNAAAAIEFYCKAFGAVEESRLPGPDGKLMHASVRINGAPLYLVDEMLEHGALSPQTLKGSPIFIHLQVPDVDAVVAQAVGAGATITMPVADMFWGDRYGQLTDPFGHRWSIATRKHDLTHEQITEALQNIMPPAA